MKKLYRMQGAFNMHENAVFTLLIEELGYVGVFRFAGFSEDAGQTMIDVKPIDDALVTMWDGSLSRLPLTVGEEEDLIVEGSETYGNIRLMVDNGCPLDNVYRITIDTNEITGVVIPMTRDDLNQILDIIERALDANPPVCNEVGVYYDVVREALLDHPRCLLLGTDPTEEIECYGVYFHDGEWAKRMAELGADTVVSCAGAFQFVVLSEYSLRRLAAIYGEACEYAPL